MNPEKINPVIRAMTAAAVLLSLLGASDQAPNPPDVEDDFGQPPLGECLPGQRIVYMRPPHPGSSTKAASREPSTLWGRAAALERTIAYPDLRASTTLRDFVDVLTPDQKVCK